MRRRLMYRLLIVLVIATLFAPGFDGVHAQKDTVITLQGQYAIQQPGLEAAPLLVGMVDASLHRTEMPLSLPSASGQYLAEHEVVGSRVNFTLDLPAAPTEFRAFDVTGGVDPSISAGVMIFDVRLMTNLGRREKLSANERLIASSLRLTMQRQITGGVVVVWAANNQQLFPTGPGIDAELFTADDPRAVLPPGWTIVSIRSTPYRFSQENSQRLVLIPLPDRDEVDYSNLTCADLLPALIDNIPERYPFTSLHGLNWKLIGERLIPDAEQARSFADCERIVQVLGNEIPDGHVQFYLNALRPAYQATTGLLLVPLADNEVAVARIMPDSPASRSNIRVGAIITRWAGQPIGDVAKTTLLFQRSASTNHALLAQRLIDLELGPENTGVEITFENPGEGPQTVQLRRVWNSWETNQDIIDINDRPRLLDSGMGYVRIHDFFDLQSVQEFPQTLRRLMIQGAEGIIVDVRNNPGGYAQISDALASNFFTEEFDVATMRVEGDPVALTRVEPRPFTYEGPVAVLIDAGSSSAAELFTYTMSLEDRALVVGSTPTGGMLGTVADGVYLLPNDSMLAITTGALYDTRGAPIVEGQGVNPDLLVPMTQDALVSGEDFVLAAAERALQEALQRQ